MAAEECSWQQLLLVKIVCTCQQLRQRKKEAPAKVWAPCDITMASDVFFFLFLAASSLFANKELGFVKGRIFPGKETERNYCVSLIALFI